VAITDQNNLFALVKFYKEAEKAGIKPIAGADVLVAEGTAAPSRLTLLCRDNDGYLSLSQILTRAWMEGHRVDGVVARPAWLAENAGLFAIAGPQSEPGQLFASGRHDLAEQAWPTCRRSSANACTWNCCAPVAPARTPSTRSRWMYRRAEASRCWPATTCASSMPTISKRTRRACASPAAGCWTTPAGRMTTARSNTSSPPTKWRRCSSPMHRTRWTTPSRWRKRCNLELRLGTYYLPAFPVPSDETLDSWIRSQSREGLVKRLEKAPLATGKTRADYEARLELELDVIVKMGFPGYFLIVADFINWAKQHGIPVGPGRGSGAGSLVAWALGITDLDPLPYDLLFERFLNPERVSMPDFDIDFCMDRRDEVIDYVARKYGRDRVSQIITYGTMAAKAVVRDTGRVLGIPYGFVDGLAKLIPLQPTDPMTLEDAMGSASARRRNRTASSANSATATTPRTTSAT
jgi:DNA polymerase-3 subunit alpha